METKSLKMLTVIKQSSSGGTFLITPITASVGTNEILTLLPESLQVLDTERTLFLQSNDATGLVILTLQYNGKSLARIPILINTPEGISERKANEKLINALHTLGIPTETG